MRQPPVQQRLSSKNVMQTIRKIPSTLSRLKDAAVTVGKRSRGNVVKAAARQSRVPILERSSSLRKGTIKQQIKELFCRGVNLFGLGLVPRRRAMFGCVFFKAGVDARDYPLPKAKRTLKGWSRRAPQVVKDPFTCLALMLLVDWLIGRKLTRYAVCLVVLFDGCLRPSEA